MISAFVTVLYHDDASWYWTIILHVLVQNLSSYSLVQQSNNITLADGAACQLPVTWSHLLELYGGFYKMLRNVIRYSCRWTTLSPYSGTSWFQLVVLGSTYLPVNQVVVDVLAKSWYRQSGVCRDDSSAILSPGFLLFNLSGVVVLGG